MKIILLYNLIPPIISAALYLFLYLKPWIRLKRNNTCPYTPSPNYFIGLSFSVFFYFGVPLWLWRYGWKITAKIILGCFITIFLTTQIVDLAIQFEEGGSFLFSFFIQSPIRVAIAVWLAKHDYLLLKTRKFPDFLTRKKPLQKRTSITFPSVIKK